MLRVVQLQLWYSRSKVIYSHIGEWEKPMKKNMFRPYLDNEFLYICAFTTLDVHTYLYPLQTSFCSK